MEQKLNKVGAPYGSPAVWSRYISSHSYQENHDTARYQRQMNEVLSQKGLCAFTWREGLAGLAGLRRRRKDPGAPSRAVPHGVGGTVRSCFEGAVGLHKRASCR